MIRILMVAIALALVGCAQAPPHQVQYLQSALNQATQDEVAQRLGAPARTVALTNGGSVWTYQYPVAIGLGAGAPPPGMATPSGTAHCDELVLTFDERHVLRRWRQQSCDLAPGN
jgi:hypothetical protein